MSKNTTIAIDGPAACGKTTVGTAVAKRLGFHFLDTGTMYRAVTWMGIQLDKNLEDSVVMSNLAESLNILLVTDGTKDRIIVDDQDITDNLRSIEVDQSVSVVSSFTGVRIAMVEQQRDLAKLGPMVMVGRDIGTVVLPNADKKIFLHASVRVRVQRRFDELRLHDKTHNRVQVTTDLINRDKIDTERSDSPLRPASDAICLNTDHLTSNEVVSNILKIVD